MVRVRWLRRHAAGLLLPAAFVLLGFTSPETAQVTQIVDGDTITVTTADGRQFAVRMAGIDAPESGQAFGEAAAQNLSKMISGKRVILDCLDKWSYERRICKVVLPNGKDADLEQVRAGLAWHYKQYESEQSPSDRKLYAQAEDAARKARIGLWSDSNPVQPQDFRHHTVTPLCFDDAEREHRISCSERYEGPVRGNQRSHIFHLPNCPNYNDISPRNRIEFPSVQAAHAAGYREAANCP